MLRTQTIRNFSSLQKVGKFGIKGLHLEDKNIKKTLLPVGIELGTSVIQD